VQSTEGSIQAGVQQPYTIEVTKTTPEWEQAKINVFFAYPNPTSGILTLQKSVAERSRSDNNDRRGVLNTPPTAGTGADLQSVPPTTPSQPMQCVLYDLSGKAITQKPLTNPETQIDLSKFNPGTYILRITQESKELTVIKIVKI
jgi:hypothetical protein